MSSSSADRSRAEGRVAQYALERRLAQRLMAGCREERRGLYGEVYDELFAAFPHLAAERSQGVTSSRLKAQLAIVKPFAYAGSDVTEVGSGAGHLARALGALQARVTALEVGAPGTAGEPDASGVAWVTYDGLDLPIPPASQDVVVSHQTLEHLHPEDAALLARNALVCLRPGGVFVCATPNRILGPHDVSREFADVPQGLHLHEYTLRELAVGLRAIGFEKVEVFVGWRTRYARVPIEIAEVLEAGIEMLPRAVRRRPLVRRMLTGVLGIRLAARRSGSG